MCLINKNPSPLAIKRPVRGEIIFNLKLHIMPKKKKQRFNARCADLLHLWIIESVGESPQNPDNALRMHMYLSKMFQAYVSFAFHVGDGVIESDLAAMSSLTSLIEDYHQLFVEERK